MSTGGLPRVTSKLSLKVLKEECHVRGLNIRGITRKNDLLETLVYDTILLCQTQAYLQFQQLKAQNEREILEKADASRKLAAERNALAAAKKAQQQRNKREKEIATQKAVHDQSCPKALHSCKLALTSRLMFNGKARSYTATCNVRGLTCDQGRSYPKYSCDQCNFDVCAKCFEFASLPKAQQTKKRKEMDDAERKAQEKRRKHLQEQEKLREARRRKQEEASKKLLKKLEATTDKVKKPSGKNKTRQKPLKYIVWSSCGYDNDGWHSYEGPPSKSFDSCFASKKEANDRVSYLFYVKNTWGLGPEEIINGSEMDIGEQMTDGLLKLEVAPPDSERWTVAAVPKEAFGHMGNVDSDRGYSSSDDAEDEQFAHASDDEQCDQRVIYEVSDDEGIDRRRYNDLEDGGFSSGSFGFDSEEDDLRLRSFDSEEGDLISDDSDDDCDYF